MKSRLRHLLTDLIGRSDQRLVDILGGQVEAAVDGAILAKALVEGHTPAADARTVMSRVEHRGDQQRARLVAALSATLTAPMDREDLFRLSRCVDDVLDNLRDFVRESHLYGLGRQPGLTPVLDALVEGLRALESATRQLLSDPRSASRTTLAARKSVGRIRQSYQIELAELFDGPLDMRTLKRREVLRRLDVAGRCLSEAADALADGIMKRGR